MAIDGNDDGGLVGFLRKIVADGPCKRVPGSYVFPKTYAPDAAGTGSRSEMS